MKTLQAGSAGHDRMQARTLAISRGEHRPAEREPTVGFTSVESFAKAPYRRDCELSALIAEEHPASLAGPAAPAMAFV